MTGRDAQALERELVQSIIADQASGAPKADTDARVRRAERLAFERHVAEVYGYTLEDIDTGETVTPKNGVELYAALEKAPASEQVVLRDILGAIESHSRLSGSLRGKSLPPSASGLPGTEKHGAGGAPSADGKETLPSSTTPKSGASETATTSATQHSHSIGTPHFAAAPGAN